MAAMSASPPSVEHSSEPAPLPEEEVREAINRWSQGFFRVRYLGDKIFIDKIVPAYSYTVRLRTQYEERTVALFRCPTMASRSTTGACRPTPGTYLFRGQTISRSAARHAPCRIPIV